MSAYIFDTETTGLKHNELIEAAWIKLTNSRLFGMESRYEEVFIPTNEIEYGAMATHHIHRDDLLFAERDSIDFKLPDDCEYIIGHNIDYDWKVIGSPNVKRICTLAFARKILPDIDSHSQSALMYYYFGKGARDALKNAHRALDDVINLHSIIMKMLPPFDTFEEMWEESEKARIPDKITFGKHKGEFLKNLPKDYVAWLLRQNDLDEYLLKALKGL